MKPQRRWSDGYLDTRYLVLIWILVFVSSFVLGCSGTFGEKTGYEGSPPVCLKGDFNHDAKITSYDVTQLGNAYNWSLKGKEMPRSDCELYDIDGNDVFDDKDVLALDKQAKGES